MAIKLTGESFLQCVRQSQLLDPEALNRILQEFRQHGVRFEDSRALADEFVARNSLTRWQAEKLLQGKHKGFFLGKYRLLSLLGKGGMSSVYLAEHVLMRRRCAIKVLPSKRVNDSSYLGRFHREAQAVAALDHPNIVRAYDVDKEVEKDTEIHFLVMEYVDGQSLHDLIAKDGVLGFTKAAEYIRQAAHGLSHAHHAGMVHRDIKPGNLLVDLNETVKILDLGLARFFNEEDEQSLTVAHDEKVLGTADYLAPEQALDSHRVDARADIYSLGCTFFFLLTGHPPFTEGTLAQRLMAHQTKQPPPLEKDRPDAPAELSAIISKMMAKKLPERFQSAEEVADAITEWLSNFGDEAWRKKHGRLAASRRPAQSDVPPVAAPVVTATPLSIPAPAPLWNPLPAAEPAAANGSEFAAFLSGLEQSPPPLSKPASSKSGIKPASAQAKEPASNVVRGSQPASGTGSGPISAVPVASAVEASGSSVAAAAAPIVATVISELPSGTTVPVATAVTTVATIAEPVQAVVVEAKEWRAEAPPPRPASTVVRSRKPSLIDQLKSNRAVLIGGAVAVAGVVLVALFSLFSGGDSPKKPGAPGTNAGGTNSGGAGTAASAQELTVGPNGQFQTIGQALKQVTANWQGDAGSESIVIKVAGGRSYSESIVLNNAQDDFPSGIRIVSEGSAPAVLAPGGTDPVLKVSSKMQKLTIEGFDLDASGRPTAVELAGTLPGLRLKNLRIRGFAQTGLLGKAPVGFSQFDGEVQLENVTFEPGSPGATGVRLQAISATDTTSQVKFVGCRFLGPMATGIVLADDTQFLQIRENIFAQTQTGVLLEGSNRVWQNVQLINNTFYKSARPVVFSEQPNSRSNAVAFYRNLFAEPGGPEVQVLKDYSNDAFLSVLEGSIAGMAGNFTTRAKPPMSAGTEVDYMFNRQGGWQVSPGFASTDPKDGKFLAPGTGTPLANVPQPGKHQKPHVGAVAPQ